MIIIIMTTTSTITIQIMTMPLTDRIMSSPSPKFTYRRSQAPESK